MMNAMGGGSGKSQQESAAQKKLLEMQKRQDDLLSELIRSKTEKDHSTAMNNPVLHRLEGIEKKLEMMRKKKLQQKEKGGMPKFLMYMQQNMMNQAMMQAHLNDPDPSLDQYPRIVPVAVDPRKRIMPFSSNPFINFEMNKPAGKVKDVGLDYETINNLLTQAPERAPGEEYEVPEVEEEGEEEEEDSSQD